jgi:hypothetical protein
MSKTAHCTIDIDDVIKAGSVEKAIEEWSKDSSDTASGVVGSELSTSGPGPGWTIKHDATDFAKRALEQVPYYLDSEDGRLAYLVDENGDPYEDEIDKYKGELKLEWSDESVVALKCPDIEDAIENPSEFADMAQSIINYHHAESDTEAWKKLLESINNLADAIGNIDVEGIPLPENQEK